MKGARLSTSACGVNLEENKIIKIRFEGNNKNLK